MDNISDELKNVLDGVKESLEKIKFDGIMKVPTINNDYNYLSPIISESSNLSEAAETAEKYRNDVLQTLKGIEQNTSSLKTMVDLLQDSNENQEVVLTIITQILELTKLNKNEAEGKLKGIMRNITDVVNSGEAIGKLINLALFVVSNMK